MKIFFLIILITFLLTTIYLLKPKQFTKPSPSAWQTYTNTKYGFEIKYQPDKFEFSDNKLFPKNAIFGLDDIKIRQQVTECRCGETSNLSISVFPNPKDLSFEDFAKKQFPDYFSPDEIRLSTFLGTKMFGFGGMSEFRLFKHENKIYVIYIGAGRGNFEETIHTFMFI